MASKHNFNATTISRAVLDELVDVVNWTASKYQITIKESMNRKSPPPSTPGSPPGVRTGSLRRSFTTRPAKRIGSRVVLALGTNTKYARPLEYGTRKMAARPFMRPALNDPNARASLQRRLAASGDRIRRAMRSKVRPIR